MANNLLVSPIRLDSVMTQGFKASTQAALGYFQYLQIKAIRWVGPATVGDTFTIEDLIAGNVLATAECGVVKQDVLFDYNTSPRRWADFQLTQISSGVVWVYTA